MKKFLSILCLAALTYHSNAMAYSIVEVKDTTIQPKSDDTLRLRIGQMKIDIYPDSSAVIQVGSIGFTLIANFSYFNVNIASEICEIKKSTY